MPAELTIPTHDLPDVAVAPFERSVHNAEPWTQREMLALIEIAMLIGKSFEPAVAIRSMLHLMSELLGLNRGRVVLRNGVENEIAIAYAYGLRPDEIRRGIFKVGEGITGRAFKSGGILIVQDIDNEPLYLARTVARADLPAETVGFLALPILIDGAVEGVLAVYRLRQRDRAISDDLQVLQIVASLIGQVLNVNRIAAEQVARLEAENSELKAALVSSAAVAPDTPAAALHYLPAPEPNPALGVASTVRAYQSVDADDRAPIEAALRLSRNNKSRAAQRLGLTLRQLNYRMKVLNISLPERMP